MKWLTLIICFCLSFAAAALESFSQKAINEAISKQENFLVYVHATQCPSCEIHKKYLSGYKAPVKIFELNYDKEKDFLNKYEGKGWGYFLIFTKGQKSGVDRANTSAELDTLLKTAFTSTPVVTSAKAEDKSELKLEVYNKNTFDEALKKKENFVAYVHAPWCSVCVGLMKVIKETKAPIRILEVSFDKDKEFLEKYKIPAQGMFVAFSGGKEVNRGGAFKNSDDLKNFAEYSFSLNK